MARGGGTGLIKVEDKLQELIEAYRGLTSSYRHISEYGHEEVILIDQGDMESLIDLLRKKEEIMVKVAQYQEQIGTLQQLLADYYKIEQFTIKRLMAIISNNYRDLVKTLQNVIKQLVKQLEILEEQEKIHEKMLKAYSTHLQVNNNQKSQKNTAKKAYEKNIEQNIDNRDLEKKC